MSINFDDSFEVGAAGVSITDNAGNVLAYIAGGSGSPVGTAAPINTWYFRTDNNLIYYKFGSGNNDWRQIRANDIAFDVSALVGNSVDLTGLTQTFAVVSALANRHFGKRFQPSIQAAEVVRTSTDYFTSNTLSYTNLPSGNYLLLANYEAQKSLVNNRAERRWTVNGATVNETEISIADDDIYYGFTSSFQTPLSGDVTINFDLRKSASGLLGGQVLFRNRQLLIWRLN